MTDKMIVEAIYEHLKRHMIESDFIYDEYALDQARALFTSLCVIGDISPDTSACDNMLLELYEDSDMESIDEPYDNFNAYMCELLV